MAPCWAGCLSAIERSGFVDPGVACWTLLVVMFLLVVELQACCSAKALTGVDAAFGGLLVRFVGCCGVLAECYACGGVSGYVGMSAGGDGLPG